MVSIHGFPLPYLRQDGALNCLLVSTAGSALGTGGMLTKIVAARLATSVGVTTIITRSSNPGNIVKIARYEQAQRTLALLNSLSSSGDSSPEDSLVRSTASLRLDRLEKPPLHTCFLPAAEPMRDRHFWLLHTLRPNGTVFIDSGAYNALLKKAGLLPAGVVDIEGNFSQQEAVRIAVVEKLPMAAPNGRLWTGTPVEVGRAIVNYAAHEVARIKGHQSSEIRALLGYADSEYVVERQHIKLFPRDSQPPTPTGELVREQTDGLISGITGYELKSTVQ